MKELQLPSSTITRIVDDPSSLADPSSAGLSSSMASYILDHGYTKGFRSVFILNACLTVLATLVSITMIKHKNLTRGDEEGLKKDYADREEKLKNDRSELRESPASDGADTKTADHQTADEESLPQTNQTDIELGQLRQDTGKP